MMWAVTFGKTTKVTDTMAEQRYSQLHKHGDIKQYQLLMDSWTDGMADKTISHPVQNGSDSWRKLYHQQPPEIRH